MQSTEPSSVPIILLSALVADICWTITADVALALWLGIGTCVVMTIAARLRAATKG